MNSKPRISVYHPEKQELNGLGMMMLQYMEQNFEEFEYKVKQGLRLQGKVAVEVEKGISTTITFQGEKVRIENGIGDKPDLYLKSSYLLLSKVLAGKADPFLQILRGNLKLMIFPRKPFMSIKILRFIKIPAELLLEPRPSPWKRYYVRAGMAILLLGSLLLLVFLIIYK